MRRSFLWLLLLSTSLLGEQQLLERLIQAADATAPHMLMNSEEMWRQKIVQHSERCLEWLPDLSSEGSMIAAAAALAQSALETEGPLELRDLKGERPGVGLSGNRVIRVSTHEKKGCIIKVMPLRKAEFLQEVLMTDLLQQLKLSHLQAISLLGSAQWRDPLTGEVCILLAQSLAPGVAIESKIIDLMLMPRVTTRRIALFTELQQIFFQLGMGLGQLHQPKSHHMGAPHPLLHAEWLRIGSALPENQEIQQLLIEGWGALSSREVQFSFTHGDAHFSNYFFHPKEGITAIDLFTGARSVGSGRKPIGIAAYDVARVLEQLQMRTLFGVTREESQELFRFFQQGYLASGASAIPSHELRACLLIHHAEFISAFLGKLDRYPLTLRPLLSRILSDKLKRMRGELEGLGTASQL